MSLLNKGEIGKIGEKTAAVYLARNGHNVLDINYRKPWGEIDIITRKGSVIHFVEVKTVTRDLDRVDRGGYRNDYEVGENMHVWKRKRLHRIIATYLEDKWGKVQKEPEWYFDVVLVTLDVLKRRARVELLEDLELL